MSVGRMNRRAFGAAWSLNYALVSLVIIASWPAPVEARDIYTTLTDNAGESCHERDCRPAHYRRTAAGVEMLVGEEWTAVPDETIQYRALEGGRNGRRPLGVTTRLRTIITFCAVLPRLQMSWSMSSCTTASRICGGRSARSSRRKG